MSFWSRLESSTAETSDFCVCPPAFKTSSPSAADMLGSMGRLGTSMEQRTKMAVASNSVEIDPVFIKALKLLHSKHPDSLDQLRALRDEVVRQHNQQAPTSSKVRNTNTNLNVISYIMQAVRTQDLTCPWFDNQNNLGILVVSGLDTFKPKKLVSATDWA